ncbi:hypothetical protein [Duganella sp. Root1480D1]|uniref:hypothetical protein n=1 Tax=Duganella sp. Root1480D1 TaxID=1736471 RepID=UPI00070DD788|nr:hypothetical protein [Duganella sp. Root1480D1]KQZ40064.1 hypothetical protein ASD58_06720 [Duganella sp. Root1480D1]
MQVPGYASASELFRALEAEVGAHSFEFVGEFGPSFDALGFRLLGRERYLFSVSTHSGELPFGRYELQVSISDESQENGEIVLLEDVDEKRLLFVVNEVRSGAFT